MPQKSKAHKLIVTIVQKEKAKKVVQASQKAGARGGTTFIGRGLGRFDKMRFLGIPLEREREIIFTVVSEDILEAVLEAITTAVDLDKPRHGIGFVIDVAKIIGIHDLNDTEEVESENKEENQPIMAEEQKRRYDLIITIVNQGDSDTVVEASKRAGAEGGTILHGRGTGIHEQAKLFNILIEPEKEVVLTLIPKHLTNQVLEEIGKAVEINKPGKGIAFVLEVDRTVGINHSSDHQ